MRPLKHQPILLSSHLFTRNGVYYYRANIPVDLQLHFPTDEVKKSFKTKDSKTAKGLALSMEYRLQRTYAMIRSGMLTEPVIQGMVAELYPRKVATADKPKGVLLSGAIKDYVKVQETNWTYKTKLEIAGCYRLILDVLGDMEIKAINKQMVVDFRGKVMSLPANLYKIYPGKTIDEVLSLPDIKPMSITSVNKYIARLNALLSYCVKEGVIAANYAHGMMVAEKRRADEERKAYSTDDVKMIVGHLPCGQDRPERFWIPLIAMYSGLRLDEVCQLYVEDFQQIDGVWCFSVNDEKDKKVKTLSGKRVVPVHPTLLKSGFESYVVSLRNEGAERLWSNLNWREADGYSNALGKWYQKYNRKYVTDDVQKTFHSLRHLVCDTLKQAGITEIVIAEIMGHANDSMTTGRYGKRYQPKVLLEAMLQLDYGVEVPAWKK